jgi:hypothetical protein
MNKVIKMKAPVKIARAQFAFAVKLSNRTVTSIKPGDGITAILQGQWIVMKADGKHAVTSIYNLQYMQLEDEGQLSGLK